MAIDNIDIKKIRKDESRFSLKDVLFMPEGYSCDESFSRLGILNAVIVQKSGGGGFDLIDGRKRLEYAERNRMDVIDAVVLPDETPVTDIITLLLYDKRDDIASSVMNRVQFIDFAVSFRVPEEWVMKSLCIPFGFRPHGNTLSECGRISAMPGELRRFCHERKYSMRQLISLSSFPGDLLGLLVEWVPHLQLTASIMDEMASSLRDWLRLNNKKVSDLGNDEEIRDILDSSISPRDKTNRLRHVLLNRRFPVLSEVNSRIERTVTDIELPEEVAVNWDRTLENRNVAVSINLNDPGKWRNVLDALNSKELKDALRNILNEL